MKFFKAARVDIFSFNSLWGQRYGVKLNLELHSILLGLVDNSSLSSNTLLCWYAKFCYMCWIVEGSTIIFSFQYSLQDTTTEFEKFSSDFPNLT